MSADRLIIVQVVRIARCLDEHVVADPRDADTGVLLGWGSLVFRGGPIPHIHRVGVGASVELRDHLAARHSRHFVPPTLLRDMADQDAAFYGRQPPVATQLPRTRHMHRARVSPPKH